jgi:predicted DNA-binding transcriptional regulator AlpA
MTTPKMDKLAYSVKEAADICSVSTSTIHRAIHATSYDSFPPPLMAKRKGRHASAQYLLLRVDLEEWLVRFPDG